MWGPRLQTWAVQSWGRVGAWDGDPASLPTLSSGSAEARQPDPQQELSLHEQERLILQLLGSSADWMCAQIRLLLTFRTTFSTKCGGRRGRGGGCGWETNLEAISSSRPKGSCFQPLTGQQRGGVTLRLADNA